MPNSQAKDFGELNNKCSPINVILIFYTLESTSVDDFGEIRAYFVLKPAVPYSIYPSCFRLYFTFITFRK